MNDFVLVVSGAVGGLVLNFAKDLLTRLIARKEKERDRLTATHDAHHRELRDAYASFISSYSRFVAVAGDLNSHRASLTEIKERAYDTAVEQGADGEDADGEWERATSITLVQKISQLQDAYWTATHEANRAGVVVLLLEGEASFYERVKMLTHDELQHPLLRRADHELFRLELAKRIESLSQLTHALSGRFAPIPISHKKDAFSHRAIDRAAPLRRVPQNGSLVRSYTVCGTY